MSVFTVREAQKHFLQLLARVTQGEEVIITKAGQPIARLVPLAAETNAPRVFGRDQGLIIIQANFDAPLPEFDL